MEQTLAPSPVQHCRIDKPGKLLAASVQRLRRLEAAEKALRQAIVAEHEITIAELQAHGIDCREEADWEEIDVQLSKVMLSVIRANDGRKRLLCLHERRNDW